jgi:hypothetical protein
MGEIRNAWLWFKFLKGRCHSEDLSVGWKIILKKILE